MKEKRVLARTKYEAIARIREQAALAKRGGRYHLVRRYFWPLVWGLLCICVALVAGRPLAALVLLALPFGLRLLRRLMKTAYGLLMLAGVVAYVLYQVGSVVPKVGRFLEGTTFKFVSGNGARVIPHSGDVIRLYAQDDVFIGGRLKSVGDTVYPGDRLLIADFAKELMELQELQESVRPQEAYLDFQLSQHEREREETQTRLKDRELEREQVGFEKGRFERQAVEGLSALEAYRGLLNRGLISQREFLDLEREYERLKTTQQQLGLEVTQLSAALGEEKEKDLLTREYRYEKARTDFLKFRAESQRRWLTHLAYIAAPGSGPDRFEAGEEIDYSVPAGLAPEGADRSWSSGTLIYLAGSHSSSQVRRGDLVAEIWVGRQRKRIGLELPQEKMMGIEIGSPVNFMLDEEVGDIGEVVHGRIEKIRQGRDSKSFWIEAGELATVREGDSLDRFSIGLAGNYRIGLRPISHKEKYLKIRSEARSLGEMWASLRQYAAAYVRRQAGEDFVVDPRAAEK